MKHGIFVSHSWCYENSREGLTALLDARPGFEYSLSLVPLNSPVHKNQITRDLHQAVGHEMRHVGVVVILSGVYNTYQFWIDEEIATAKEMNKKILVVEPWGHERTEEVLNANADRFVGWDTARLTKAVRDLCRPSHPGQTAPTGVDFLRGKEGALLKGKVRDPR